MTDNEITEAYFIALGCEWKPFLKEPDIWSWAWCLDNEPIAGRTWSKPECHAYSENCTNPFPNIRDSFTQLKKWVIDPMEGENYVLTVSGGKVVYWLYLLDTEHPIFDETITNGDIPLAMIKSATRYWESKNAKGS